MHLIESQSVSVFTLFMRMLLIYCLAMIVDIYTGLKYCELFVWKRSISLDFRYPIVCSRYVFIVIFSTISVNVLQTIF